MKNVSKEFFLALIEEIPEIKCSCKITETKEKNLVELTQSITNVLFSDTQVKRKENTEYLLITKMPNYYKIFTNEKYNLREKKVSKN